jgi:cephalosporin hydroxylase
MFRRKIETVKMLYKKGGIKLILRHFLKKYACISFIENKTSIFSCLSMIILDKPLIVAQNMEEFNEFIIFLKKRNIKNVLEIGTYKGGTAFLFKKLLNANVTTIDIKNLLPIKIALKLKGIRAIQSNSHNKETLEKVKGNYDLLFIDGDHAYESVKKDFEMYSPLVRKGGIIAFHDIFINHDVNIFWNEIKRNHNYLEIKNNKPLGIGVILK